MSLDWFPFEPKPFITDTLRLPTEAKGAYLMLILDYYDQERPAPDDDEVLAAITGLPIETWRRHRRVIEPLFNVRDGFWHHNKCAAVLATQHAKMKQVMDAAAASVAARAAKRAAGKAPVATLVQTPVVTGEQRSLEPDFGPSERTLKRPSQRPLERALERALPDTSDATSAQTSVETTVTTSVETGVLQNRRIEEGIREGANAPSPAGLDLIGSLIDPAFMPSPEACQLARDDGVLSLIGPWLDQWKQRCMDAGTRNVDWHAAWGREYHHRMLERAKAQPKPRVSVSKKPKLTKLPDNWEPNESHYAISEERKLDMRSCVQSFADHIVNKNPDWRDADAAFRNWLKSPHRTEFTRNGQAQSTPRRAPAPGGGSIVDAFDRLEQRIDAAAGGSPAHDRADGKALVHRVPEE